MERTIQSVQEMIRTIRSAVERRWQAKIDVTDAFWPWISEQVGFFLTMGDGKTAYERLTGIRKSAR